jgi:hypothetical protein
MLVVPNESTESARSYTRTSMIEQVAVGPVVSVLILHRVRAQGVSPRFTQQGLRILSGNPAVKCVAHDVSLPMPRWLSRLDFDAFFLDSSMLGYRWAPKSMFDRVRESVAFLSRRRGLKIAFPMDEFDRSAALDRWLSDLGVDLVCTTLYAQRHLLLPECCSRAEVIPAWTSYIDDGLLQGSAGPLAGRPVDVGYRTRKLPFNFGRFGQLKSQVGERLRDRLAGSSLVHDVEVGEAFRIDGDAWIRFLRSCKFVLGAPSGSSIHDPSGAIDMSVQSFLSEQPNADFDTVERACFPGIDGRHEFSVLSPRVFEASMAGCCQVLVRGEYGGLLRPDEHYLPIERDFSNLDEVLERLKDIEAASDVSMRCRDALLSEPTLHANVRDRTLYAWICERRRPSESVNCVRDVLDAVRVNGGRQRWMRHTRAALDRASSCFHRFQGRLPDPLGRALLRLHGCLQAMRPR